MKERPSHTQLNSSSETDREALRGQIDQWNRVGYLLFEKCELKEAKNAFEQSLCLSEKLKDPIRTAEALAGLLRFSGECLDEQAIHHWDQKLDELSSQLSDRLPAKVWYCKGAIASHRENWILAQRYFHRFLRVARIQLNSDSDEGILSVARAWLMLANTLMQRGRLRRAQWVVEKILHERREKDFPEIEGMAHLMRATLFERKKQFNRAMRSFQKADGWFLRQHHWYYHLYILYGYARLCRHQRQYTQAQHYLDLISNAIQEPEFAVLQREVTRERKRLQQDAVDLMVDVRKGVVKTKGKEAVSLRKQYVLMELLRALSEAHRQGPRATLGLSKAELIEKVWQEKYDPKAHDNKLYYNINRLRKLLESDVHHPKYLLNSKKGYRLAPGLTVQLIKPDDFEEEVRDIH